MYIQCQDVYCIKAPKPKYLSSYMPVLIRI